MIQWSSSLINIPLVLALKLKKDGKHGGCKMGRSQALALQPQPAQSEQEIMTMASDVCVHSRTT